MSSQGGNNEDMVTVLNAYQYIKEQIENINDKTYEELEEEFEEFCKKQEKTKPPKFSEIYEETNDWIKEFNKEFEKANNINTNEDKENPYKLNIFKNQGYGHLMDNNKIKDLEYKDSIDSSPKNKFTSQIIKYEEPKSYCDILNNNFPLDKKKIDDFSSNILKDYFKAYCEPETILNEFNFEEDIMKNIN